MPPSGRIRKDTANTSGLPTVDAVGLPPGKKVLPMQTAV
jgi:hypothetical protein